MYGCLWDVRLTARASAAPRSPAERRRLQAHVGQAFWADSFRSLEKTIILVVSTHPKPGYGISFEQSKSSVS